MDNWEARFRAVRMSLPSWAPDAPHRCLYASNATGTVELYAWDRVAGTHRQVTQRANGTYAGALEPGGEGIWWFDDTDGDEYGVWRRQPFGGGPDEPAVPGLEPAYPAGLGLGRRVAAVGRSTEEGSTVWLSAGPEPARLLYAHREDAGVGGLSTDETLLAISHSEHGDALKPAVRVLAVADGQPVAELWDGPGKGLDVVGFSPVAGDPRLLLRHERAGQRRPLVYDPLRGAEHPVELELVGEVTADWYADAGALLITHELHGRSELYRYDLATGALARLDTPAGIVSAATARPDGTVEYAWSCAATAPVLRVAGNGVLLEPPGPGAPPSVPVEDAWAPGPGGRVHALLARPAGDPPYPAVFLVHGGPMWHDRDHFEPTRAAWVDEGYAVVQVNYRGSTGYGSAWQDAINGQPGLTELEDLRAMRELLAGAGLIDPDRLVLAGGSWGGYLTLLGLGTEPAAWAVGVAAVPVADYVAAYAEEMEALRGIDRALFGGSPEEVPERYATASPISYVDAVRAPVLVLAGENDPRCPIGQVENYLERLAARGAVHEVYRFDAGHGSLVVEERIRQMRAELDFARRHLPRT